MKCQFLVSILAIAMILGGDLTAVQAAVTPATQVQVVTQADVVSACAKGGNAQGCQDIVKAFVAYLKVSGMTADQINKVVAEAVQALVKNSASLPPDVRAVVAEAVNVVATASSDTQQIAAIREVATTVANGSFSESSSVSSGKPASPG
ncbi:MAG TPA: hypothetical protein VL418_07890 [Devosiaceae bacterium]|nr:hypothetical protein [Devosiaceae bacterium]